MTEELPAHKPLQGENLRLLIAASLKHLDQVVALHDHLDKSTTSQIAAFQKRRFLILDTRSLVQAMVGGYVNVGQPRIVKNMFELIDMLSEPVDTHSEIVESMRCEAMEFLTMATAFGITAENQHFDARRDVWRNKC